MGDSEEIERVTIDESSEKEDRISHEDNNHDYLLKLKKTKMNSKFVDQTSGIHLAESLSPHQSKNIYSLDALGNLDDISGVCKTFEELSKSSKLADVVIFLN